MARFAGRWESGACVIRVRRCIISIRVAACAVVRRIVVIPKMTSCAIVGYRHMPTIQGIEIIVDIECGRTPTRLCCVAAFTVRREARRRVAGVHRLRIILCMTAGAVIWRIAEVTTSVASGAVIGYGSMRPGQYIEVIVIEGRWHPGILSMARFTIRWKARTQVIWIGGCVISILMAAITCIRRIAENTACMASSTIVGNGSMCPVQDVEIIVNI